MLLSTPPTPVCFCFVTACVAASLTQCYHASGEADIFWIDGWVTEVGWTLVPGVACEAAQVLTMVHGCWGVAGVTGLRWTRISTRSHLNVLCG